MLTFGFSDFLFSVVSQQDVVQGFVGHETGTYLVVVHTLVALVGEIFGDVEVAVLGWFDDLSVDFEGEGSEVFVVDSSACEYVFFDVFAEGFDDEVELGFDDAGTFTTKVIGPRELRAVDLGRAIAATLGGSSCTHEHDCCGCPTTHASVKRTSAREYFVHLHITRNY